MGGDQLAALQERHAVLRDHDPARRQATPAVPVEVLAEQRHAGPHGVDRIDDDDVEAPVAAGDEFDRVGDHQVGARVLEGVLADRAQVGLGQLDDAGVDIDHGDPLDGAVLQGLLEHAAVAAADDQHLARGAVGQDRHVREHLVVDELVALGGLDDIVQDQHPAQGPVLEHDHALMRGPAVVEDFFGFQLESQTRVQDFLEPPGHRTRPRRISSTARRPGRKAARRTSIAARGSAQPHMKTSSAA